MCSPKQIFVLIVIILWCMLYWRSDKEQYNVQVLHYRFYSIEEFSYICNFMLNMVKIFADCENMIFVVLGGNKNRRVVIVGIAIVQYKMKFNKITELEWWWWCAQCNKLLKWRFWCLFLSIVFRLLNMLQLEHCECRNGEDFFCWSNTNMRKRGKTRKNFQYLSYFAKSHKTRQIPNTHVSLPYNEYIYIERDFHKSYWKFKFRTHHTHSLHATHVHNTHIIKIYHDAE